MNFEHFNRNYNVSYDSGDPIPNLIYLTNVYRNDKI